MFTPNRMNCIRNFPAGFPRLRPLYFSLSTDCWAELQWVLLWIGNAANLLRMAATWNHQKRSTLRAEAITGRLWESSFLSWAGGPEHNIGDIGRLGAPMKRSMRSCLVGLLASATHEMHIRPDALHYVQIWDIVEHLQGSFGPFGQK